MPSDSAESDWHWTCRENSTKIDRRTGCKRSEVIHHPLDLSHLTNIPLGNRTPSRSIAGEPLVLMLDGNDPLSAFHKRQMEPSNIEDDDLDNARLNDPTSSYKGMETWTQKKAKILSQCNTHELSSNMSCFSFQDRDRSLSAIRGNHRDDFEEGITVDKDLSAQEFCKRLEHFHTDMIRCWNEDQRVKALKIAIQCSKLLLDTLPHSYYPNKFVYVTDILDTFGNLVYTRLNHKCRLFWKSDRIKEFPDQFTSNIVPEEAKETCSNWFYKIASIRELIPRLYVEAALLRSYSFIKTGENDKILKRLTEAARGIGDPLVNLYSRCYLCRICVLHKVDNFKFFPVNFNEFMIIYDTIYLKLPKIHKNFPKYIAAFIPPLEWIVQGVIADNEECVHTMFERFRSKQDNALLLYVALTTFPSSFILSRTPEIMEWLQDCNFEYIPRYKFACQLAHCYAEQRENFGSVVPLTFINAIWDFILKVDNVVQYLTCLEQWLPLSTNHLPPERIDDIFEKTIKLIYKDRSDEKNVFKQLRDVVLNITQCVDDFLPILTAKNFLPFVNVFRDDQTKIPVCKSIMEAFVKHENDGIISDSIILNNLMVVAKAIHDSLSALTVVDERRQIGNLLSKFVLKIDFGHDYEHQLNFYVEARGTFFNSDAVHYTLVQLVNKLACDTQKRMKDRHKSKTSAFLRACAAYCFITIPSLSSPLHRLQLYMLSGQVALTNQCLGQAESFFQETINVVLEFTETVESASSDVKTEPILISYIQELFSILLVVPDNPEEKVVLGLLRKLIDNIAQFHWEDSSATIGLLYINALHVLSVAYQSDRILDVDSNEVPYASNRHFKNEINRMCSIYLEEILSKLKALGVEGKLKKQGTLAYELFVCILLRADLSKREMAKLAANLWNLACKNITLDQRIVIEMLESCRKNSPAESMYAEVFSKLLSKFK